MDPIYFVMTPFSSRTVFTTQNNRSKQSSYIEVSEQNASVRKWRYTFVGEPLNAPAWIRNWPD